MDKMTVDEMLADKQNVDKITVSKKTRENDYIQIDDRQNDC
jgi:hypothetical protein